MVFNGVDLSALLDSGVNDMNMEYYIVNGVYGRGTLIADNTTISVTNVDGVYPTYTREGSRILTVEVTIKAETTEHLHRKIEALKEVLYTKGEPAPITFDDEHDRTYYGIVDSIVPMYEGTRINKLTITILCPDPAKYGAENEVVITDNELLIDNGGTADAEPTFELTATKKSTFAMVSNGDEEYNLIGEPTDVSHTAVEEKTVLIDELGDTLSTWDIPSGSGGSFKADSNGIYVSSFGTGSGWHGPSVEKEVPPAEDYEIEFFTRVRTEQDIMTFRTSLNYYDENMNDLGLLRVWDRSDKRTAKIVEARMGAYTGVNHVNYLISSNNYLLEKSRVYNGVTRVTKKGNKFTFYSAHISQRGNHINTVTRTYIDRNNEFSGKLKFIKLGVALHGETKKPNVLNIQRARVSKLNKVLIDETPYIVRKGDVVTFDHENDDILINGEPRADLKNFGGGFFKLKRGLSSVIVTPEDSFTSKIKYRNKYR